MMNFGKMKIITNFLNWALNFEHHLSHEILINYALIIYDLNYQIYLTIKYHKNSDFF